MARKTTGYLDHLAAVPMFNACSKKELQKIARAVQEMDYPKGKVLMKQGSIGREAFIVVDGKAGVKRNGRRVAVLEKGAVVGEMALLDRGERTAEVLALTDLTVLVLGQREFSGILDEVPQLAHKLLGQLAARIRELDRKTFG